MENVSFQYEIRPELPNVYGTKDYREFRETLIKIDEILVKSGFENRLVTQALARYAEKNQADKEKFYSSKNADFHYRKLRHALRCNIARHLTSESYRLFSVRITDSTLFQWFTGISAFGCTKAISKSSLDRYKKCFDEDFIGEEIRKLISSFSKEEQALKSGLHRSVNNEDIFMDSTCIKADIHFPVDWVLLRDAARSLLLAIKSIRNQGLKSRMIEPHILLRQMNKNCIHMTHVRRKPDSKKQRKTIFRTMKQLSNRIAKHGKRYREILNKEWEKTEWTQAQAQQVINRIDNILDQLPSAIKQAHERIIVERLVESDKKILSFYDKNAHVIVRGKAGSEVEFGQGLILTEQKDGLILDWQLFKDQPPSDSKLVEPVLNRIVKHYGHINSVTADRGFGSKENDKLLEEKNIINAICPKSPKQLQKKLIDPIFIELQTRRGQTEGRIGIFKNVFLGKPLRSRIDLYKRHAINWCVLTHNLWVLSRMAIADERLHLKKVA